MVKKRKKDIDFPSPGASNEGGATRERLLFAAADAFGRFGYDGVSVRKITEAAGANIQAVAYHFGGKEGLYVAVADYLSQKITAVLRESVDGVADFMGDKRGRAVGLDAAGAADLLRNVLRHLIAVMLSPELKPLAQFMVREQMNRGGCFNRIYDNAVGPLFHLCARLVAIVQGNADPTSKRIKLRTFSTIGSVLVFRIGYATLMRQLDKDEIDKTDKRDIERLIDDLIDSLRAEDTRR